MEDYIQSTTFEWFFAGLLGHFSGSYHLLISSFKLLPLASHKIHRFEFLPHFWLTASAYLSKHFKTIKISLVEKQPQWDAQFCQNEAIKTFKKRAASLNFFSKQIAIVPKTKIQTLYKQHHIFYELKQAS